MALCLVGIERGLPDAQGDGLGAVGFDEVGVLPERFVGFRSVGEVDVAVGGGGDFSRGQGFGVALRPSGFFRAATLGGRR